MRLKDLRGAHEWIGAEALMRSLMVWRLSARKISASCRLVMRRVFEGGVGCCSGGIEERSNDIGVLDPLDETGRDVGGELSALSAAILGGLLSLGTLETCGSCAGMGREVVAKVFCAGLELGRKMGDCCCFIYFLQVLELDS